MSNQRPIDYNELCNYARLPAKDEEFSYRALKVVKLCSSDKKVTMLFMLLQQYTEDIKCNVSFHDLTERSFKNAINQIKPSIASGGEYRFIVRSGSFKLIYPKPEINDEESDYVSPSQKCFVIKC